ncbi:MAG: Rrf2 family transcriptional regulator [Planctomycetes bacterium]|nr:Rrf2 family transcriptional regulator [Planctomycetota bacterium]MCB9891545.1 Rrf2 family transcriptional regulator [Planctomycetota bacterium]
MRLTRQTDYSLRMLIYLAYRPDERVRTADIARAYGISENHLGKLVARLNDLGLIEVRRGLGGGIQLKADPEHISIGALVREFEDFSQLVECFDVARNTCVILPACSLNGALARALEAFLRTLDDFTLADVVSNPSLPGFFLDVSEDVG